MKDLKKIMIWMVVGSHVMLSACTDNDNATDASSDTETSYTDVILDSDDSMAYLNLITGEQVTEGDVWHIGINRLNVRLNDGVEAALGDGQESFYDVSDNPDVSVFTNATPETELNALLNLSDDSTLLFQADTLNYAITDWYLYDFMTHAVTPNAESNWLLYSAEGTSYAKMTVASIVQDGYEFTTTFDFYVQAENSSVYASSKSSSFTVSNYDDKTCFDFDSGVEADCAGDIWDVGMEDGEIILNGGDSASGSGVAKATGPISASDLDDYTSGSDIPLVAYTTDLLSGIFAQETWYAYGLLGRHQIWPNYRVYVVDTDATSEEDELIKLQLINYYNTEGVSGNVTVRFMPLSVTE